MLLNVREYHRPGSDEPAGLDRVLDLLARPDVRAAVLAGGDSLVGTGPLDIQAVVDLQDLGLAEIGADAGRLCIGAMATRSAVAAHPAVVAYGHGIVSQGASGWGGSVQRNRATAGGAVALAAGNDPLVAALLACDASVALYTRAGQRELPLGDFIAARAALLAAPALITAVCLPASGPSGAGSSGAASSGAALAAVGRTPADQPIVLVAAGLALDGGRCTACRLVAGGVGPIPQRLPEAEAACAGQVLAPAVVREASRRAAAAVHPEGDYRGSAAYRRAMVEVLTARALGEAWARAS